MSSTSAGSSSGGMCLPEQNSQSVPCGSLTCSVGTQACCFGFTTMPPTFACACPDTCSNGANPNVSEFQCDGPEDCDNGEVCCVKFEETRIFASCQSPNDCLGIGDPATVMCHEQNDCMLISDAICVDAPALDDVPPGLMVCLPDIYVPCDQNASCTFVEANAACLSGGSGSTLSDICATPCNPAVGCPPPPKGGYFAECVDVGNGDYRCVLPCGTDPQCDGGTQCLPLQSNPNLSICMWPVN